MTSIIYFNFINCQLFAWNNIFIYNQAEHLKDGVEKEVVDDILKKLTNLTKQKDVQLTSGDLTAASSTLLSVADHAKERLETVSSDQLEVCYN